MVIVNRMTGTRRTQKGIATVDLICLIKCLYIISWNYFTKQGISTVSCVSLVCGRSISHKTKQKPNRIFTPQTRLNKYFITKECDRNTEVDERWIITTLLCWDTMTSWNNYVTGQQFWCRCTMMKPFARNKKIIQPFFLMFKAIARF